MGIADFVLLFIFLAFYIGLFYNLPVLAAGVWDLKRSKKKESPLEEQYTKREKSLPSFSVILPVTNEKKVISRLLKAVSQLTYPAKRLEVVIVDDCSFDGTAEICQKFAASHSNFRYYQRNESLGKANALNYGLKKATGEIIAIFDADNVPDNEVLSRAAKHFCDPEVMAVQGRISSINAQENMLTQFIAYEDTVWCQVFLRGKETLGLFVHLRGSCEFIRKSVLDSMGGFDETFLAEDIAISTQLVEQGHRIKYAQDICTWQENPASIKGFIKQRIRWYRGHMEVALKYGKLLKRLNKLTIDAEFTLLLPFITIVSFLLFTFASWGTIAAVSLNDILMICMIFSTSATYILVILTGFILIFYSKPRKLKSLLWLPFIFSYWCFQSFLAMYAALLILLRRPKKWAKTEKSGKIASSEFCI